MLKKGKVLAALALVVMMVFGVSVCALADAEVTGFSDRFGEGGYLVNGRAQRSRHIDDLEHLAGTAPGTEIFMPLRTADFTWRGGSLAVNERSLGQLGIELWVEYEEGAWMFDAVKLTTREGSVGLLIDFTDELVSVNEEEFHLRAGFTVAGEEYPFEIRGTMRNSNRMVYGTSRSIALGVGRMATGSEDIDGVRFDLGAGVSMTTNIKYYEPVYGAATEGARAEDAAVLAAHPQIVKVIHLDAIGLYGNVRIDGGELGVLHVYDEDLTYLGTTAGPVRMETTYYLSTTRL